MCCGSKRSALSSASASRTSPRAVPAPPRTEAAATPVTVEPTSPAREVDVSDAAVFAPSDSSRQPPQRQSVSPHLGRRWRLSS
jgi:hypothetical protein